MLKACFHGRETPPRLRETVHKVATPQVRKASFTGSNRSWFILRYRDNKLLGTSASLLVTSALLVVTMFAIRIELEFIPHAGEFRRRLTAPGRPGSLLRHTECFHGANRVLPWRKHVVPDGVHLRTTCLLPGGDAR